MSALASFALLAGTGFVLGARWWERNPEAGRGGEPWLALTLVATLVLTDLALRSLIAGQLAAFAGIAALGAMLAPWTLNRALAIPAGSWRVAAVLGRVSGWAWNGDVHHASIVAAAAAVARRPNARGARWVSARIAGDVSAPAVVARSALALARGDVARAASLAGIALDFSESELPRAGRAVAIATARASLALPDSPSPSVNPVLALAGRWETEAVLASKPARHTLTVALEQAAAATDTPIRDVAARAATLIPYRGEDAWTARFDDLERRLERPGPLDPEAELHRWIRIRAMLESWDALENPGVWVRCERLLQRFAVRLHASAEGGPLAISVLRWVRSRAWSLGDAYAADTAHSNLALARDSAVGRSFA
jgi:hypothetical protein